MNLWSKYLRVELHASQFLRGRAIPFLRYVISLIYIWYGMLKILGISPVQELVIESTGWIFPPQFVYVLGVWEVLIGVFLSIKPLRRYGLWLFFLQIPGTFLPLFTNPEDCFIQFPFVLSLEGHYIFKNLILIGAALTILSTLHRPPLKKHFFRPKHHEH